MKDISPKIINAIKNDNLVFFVGAGFSKPLGFPLWDELIVQLLNKLSEVYPNENYETLRDAFEKGFMPPFQVLDKIKTHRNVIYDEMTEIFALDKFKKTKLDRHKKLWKITNKIITTNYDMAIESAKDDLDKTKVFIHDNKYKMQKMSSVDEYLFKIHGSIENPDECILFEDKYKELYTDKSLAIVELKQVIKDKTIIFLGCGMKDPYINYILEFIYELCGGLNNKHFLITTENVDLSKYGVVVMKLNNWDELDTYLDDLIGIKNKYIQQQKTCTEVAIATDNQKNITKSNTSKPRIAAVLASPIDGFIDFKYEDISKCFKNLSVDVDIFHLNSDRLMMLEDYDYIMLFTKGEKDYIYVEDEYLKCNKLNIEELEDLIISSRLKGVFVFIDKELEILEEIVSFPLVIYQYGNTYKANEVQKFLYKIFRKLGKDAILNRYNYSNFEDLIILETSSKKPEIRDPFVRINEIIGSDFIKHERFNDFVGRISDLEDIIRHIKDLKISNRFLNIKGSGGIGKTTIAKKVVYELAKRNQYEEGIYFVDCEHLSNYKSFEYKIAQCFCLENTQDFMEYIMKHQKRKDSIIIIDNFESLIDLDDYSSIKELLIGILNYCTILLTSRESTGLGKGYEKIYDFRSMVTDEAVELFNKNYGYRTTDFETESLKREIIEELLANNPLAIKLVTKNLPKGKDLNALKKELQTNFFEITDEDLKSISERETERNIERRKSLYLSIKYSYEKLSEEEKLVFEILSLFPNGISLENIKKLCKRNREEKKYSKINDKHLKNLENKSLVENFGNSLKLQPIVRRFAEYQFSKREEKELYYKEAFLYNRFMAMSIDHVTERIGDEIQKNKDDIAREIFDTYERNFCECLRYIDKFECDEISKYDKLNYIDYIFKFYVWNLRYGDFLKYLKNLKKYYEDIENSNLVIESIIIYLEYVNGEFEYAYDKLTKIFPMDFDINKFIKSDDLLNPFTKYILDRYIEIYLYEGYVIEMFESTIKNNFKDNIKRALFWLGEYELMGKLAKSDSLDFFILDMMFNSGELEIDKLEEYLKNLNITYYGEVVQTYYLKAKMGKIQKEEIEKLPITAHPYTYGLKDLMLALLEGKEEKAIFLYKKAINNLKHIKYYHVEAIFYFAKYLKEKNHTEYEEWFNRGIELARKHNYRFLIHKFDCLEREIEKPFNKNDYKLSVDIDIEKLVYSKYVN